MEHSPAKWLDLYRALKNAMARYPVDTVHLHGFLPTFLASVVLNYRYPDVRIVHSPHGSRALRSRRFARNLINLLLDGAHLPNRVNRLCYSGIEARMLGTRPKQLATTADPAVASVFFNASTEYRTRGDADLITTSGNWGSDQGVDWFSSIAVLLCDGPGGFRFGWLGTPSEAARSQLRAAKVEIFDLGNEEEGIIRLFEQTLLLVQSQPTLRFPLIVAQAMAAAIPVVALDTPIFREYIRDGETGFLCRDKSTFLNRMLALSKDRALRTRIGDAGRTSAESRFNEPRFADFLVRSYGMHEWRSRAKPVGE